MSADKRVKMLNVLVLILSPNVLCAITPDMLIPIKQFNEACGYDACPIPLSAGGINVHIVPHTHYEMAFQRTFAEHYSGEDRFLMKSEVNMKRTLDAVVTELWSQRYRRFTLSDFPYFFHWWSQRDENVHKMVATLLRQGRLSFVGGGWSMNDEATTNYHAIIDSFTYTLRKINATFLECGRPLVAWQADVIGHSREFASLVAQMGYDALFINPISFDDELARMRRWALEMVWRGSDDLGPQSDIFTHKLFDGYWSPPGFCFGTFCKDPLLITSDSILSNVEQRAKAFIDSIYNRQSPNYNSSHVMVIMGHMLGYFDAPTWFANIDALINAVNSRAFRGSQKMYLMYSSPACYAKAVHDANITLETKQDDFLPIAYDKNSFLTGMYTTSPSMKMMAKEVMMYLQMCKQMRVLAELDNKYNPLFENLNWIMGAFQDHTIITGSMADYIKSYYIQKMYFSVQRSTLLLKEAWNKLRRSPTDTIYYRCSFNASRCHQLMGENYFLQIYNVLAWPVTMPVRMPIQNFGEDFVVYDPKGTIIKSAVIRIPVPVLNIHSRVNASNYEVVFKAENIPPIGFKTYFIKKIKPRVKREDTPDSRPRRTIIKNMNRKPNKKFLIRQASPMLEEHTLLYDLNYDDGGSTTANPSSEKGNVSVLLENDFDELRMQQLSENYDDATLKRPEDIVESATPTVTLRAMNPGTNVNNTFRAQHWNRVAMNDFFKYRRLNEVKYLMSKMNPKRTTTPTYDKTTEIASNVTESLLVRDSKTEAVNETKEKEKETPTNKEGMTVTDESIPKNTEVRTEGEVSEGRMATEPPVRGTTEGINEPADIATTTEEINEPADITTDETTLYALDEVNTEEGERSQHQEDVTMRMENFEADSTYIENKHQEDVTMRTEKVEVDTTYIENKQQEDVTMRIEKVDSTYIENKYIRILINPETNKITSVTLSNGLQMELDIQFYYYASDDPVAMGKTGFKKPGALLFRALENKPIPILDFIDVQVYKTAVVEEAHVIYSDWTSFVIRVYDESPVIEIEWLVGPIPVDDKLGKEVFIRYLTNIVHEGVFYTDSNGRQTIKRIRNMRPMFESLNLDNVAGNFYPVTSKFSIEDAISNTCFSVFVDRAQGAATLADGEVDIMLHRRILTDDTGIVGKLVDVWGSQFSNGKVKFYLFVYKFVRNSQHLAGFFNDITIGSFVNDTEYGKGSVVRGKHYLYISRANYKPYKIFEKKFAKEILMTPQVLVSRPDPYGIASKAVWEKNINELSFLKTKLPLGIHLLTLEHWGDDAILLRLENYLEKSDSLRRQIKTVFIKELFTNIYIKSVKETTLGTNMWKEDFIQKRWNKKEKFVKSFNGFYGEYKTVEFLDDEPPEEYEPVDIDKGITLSPQQIRTFVCWFSYIDVQ